MNGTQTQKIHSTPNILYTPDLSSEAVTKTPFFFPFSFRSPAHQLLMLFCILEASLLHKCTKGLHFSALSPSTSHVFVRYFLSMNL